jgi:hypothetical protein
MTATAMPATAANAATEAITGTAAFFFLGAARLELLFAAGFLLVFALFDAGFLVLCAARARLLPALAGKLFCVCPSAFFIFNLPVYPCLLIRYDTPFLRYRNIELASNFTRHKAGIYRFIVFRHKMSK